MPRISFLVRMAFLSALVLAPGAIAATLCSVPVFRYALERWQPDNYHVVIFDRGDLRPEAKTLLERLVPPGLNPDFVGNVTAEAVDIDSLDEATAELWKQFGSESLPLMVVLSPPTRNGRTPVYSAPFDDDHVAQLLDSPARSTVTKRVLDGDSVVWILLDGGNKQADDSAEATLTKELEELQKVLKLPEIEEADIQQGLLTADPEELKLRFSTIRVSREDPAEKALVEMLLSTEPDLRDKEFDGQPMAFPVFGRGRVLYALVGKGINRETLEEASAFLTGACQCTVKAQNPGSDILTSVDWDTLIVPELEEDIVLPPLTGLGGFESEETTVTAEEATEVVEETVDPESEQQPELEAAVPAETRDPTATYREDIELAPTPVAKIAIYVVGGLLIAVVGMSILLFIRAR